MSEKCQVGAVNDLGGIREAVCIHTKKICDSCIDKDCIEDLRVFLTQDSQAILEQATNVKARSAELLYVSLDVEPAQFNTGHYTVDITYYYRILVDAIVCGTRPCTICGLSVFSKRVILCGGEGTARTFSSKAVMDGFDRQRLMQTATPDALVEVIDPMILASKVVDVCNCRCNDNTCLELPSFICGCFDGELVLNGESRRLYVTIGQFSIIRMERDTQLRIPSYSYCIPTKDCAATGSGADESPCDMFSKIKFPVSSFFPACGDSECAALAGVNDDCGCGNSNNSNSNNNCGCRIVR
ncbi:MAG TPA: hypothetical protein IAA83_00540 [Candidatus Avoscillospira avistercoris]|uniref:Uncharacterized protein n=1 Tax=Candidatus Avoscillospira avistercoris TaxID=2840707 RepID=A0A9D1F7C0_9FIRM|nr:hypothetical protein [Candidatus Avoscillospira avistercoris]